MKNLLVLFVCLLSFQMNGQSFSLIGKWKVLEKGETGFFIFSADSTIKMIDGTDTVVGNPDFKDRAVKMFFSADTTYQPFHLDMMIRDMLSGEVITRMKGIYKVITKDRIIIRFNEEGEARPKDFLPKGNSETIEFLRIL